MYCIVILSSTIASLLYCIALHSNCMHARIWLKLAERLFSSCEANKGLYHNSFSGVSKTSVTLSYHSVASQCTVTISSSNITLTTLGMLKVVPKSFHKSVATASSHAILKTSHQGSWHRGVDRHGMRSCHPMPWLRGEMSVLGWRLARNGAYISAACCLSSICLSCDLLQYCLWNSCTQDLCASSAPVLKNSLKSQLANFFWQTHFVRLTKHAATQTCKCPWVRPICIWVHCCPCRNDSLFQRTVYCKRLSVSVGRWSGCGPSFDTHQHLEKHQKLLQQFLVHGHRTHLISGGRLISHPMKFFTFGIFACTKHNYSILGVARREWGGMK